MIKGEKYVTNCTFKENLTKVTSRPKRKLILHVDVRNTILVADSVTNIKVEEALNSFLTSVAWGQIINGEWEWVHDTPRLTPPRPDTLTYYKFIERKLVKIPSDRGLLRHITGDFTSKEFGKKFRPFFDKHLKLLRWPYISYADNQYLILKERPIVAINTVDTCCSHIVKNDEVAYHYILPSFLKLIYHLHQTGRDFSIVIRTYGKDGGNVLASLNKTINGKHPGFPSSLPIKINLCPGNIKRSQDISCKMNENNIEMAYTEEKLIYEYLNNLNHEIIGIVDDFEYWQEHSYHHTAGKPMWIDLNDPNVQHIFLDDNIRIYDEDSIVDLRIRTDTDLDAHSTFNLLNDNQCSDILPTIASKISPNNLPSISHYSVSDISQSLLPKYINHLQNSDSCEMPYLFPNQLLDKAKKQFSNKKLNMHINPTSNILTSYTASDFSLLQEYQINDVSKNMTIKLTRDSTTELVKKNSADKNLLLDTSKLLLIESNSSLKNKESKLLVCEDMSMSFIPDIRHSTEIMEQDTLYSEFLSKNASCMSDYKPKSKQFFICCKNSLKTNSLPFIIQKCDDGNSTATDISPLKYKKKIFKYKKLLFSLYSGNTQIIANLLSHYRIYFTKPVKFDQATLSLNLSIDKHFFKLFILSNQLNIEASLHYILKDATDSQNHLFLCNTCYMLTPNATCNCKFIQKPKINKVLTICSSNNKLNVPVDSTCNYINGQRPFLKKSPAICSTNSNSSILDATYNETQDKSDLQIWSQEMQGIHTSSLSQVKWTGYKSLSLSELGVFEGACLVQVDLLTSISNEMYFIETVENCELKYDILLEQYKSKNINLNLS